MGVIYHLAAHTVYGVSSGCLSVAWALHATINGIMGLAQWVAVLRERWRVVDDC